MSIRLYLNSLFSFKRYSFSDVSLFAIWDDKTKFEKTSALRKFSKCFNVKVGRYSSIGGSSKVMNTVIGNFSVIARNCDIGLGAHPTNYLTCHSIFYKNKPWSKHPEWVDNIGFNEKIITHIGSDVWIGAKSTLMDGVTIGDGAIIASGSVVTKDVPPFAIVGGAPAKLIKFRFQQNIIDRLLEIQWWNLPDEEITKIIDLFHIKNPSIEDLEKFFPVKK